MLTSRLLFATSSLNSSSVSSIPLVANLQLKSSRAFMPTKDSPRGEDDTFALSIILLSRTICHHDGRRISTPISTSVSLASDKKIQASSSEISVVPESNESQGTVLRKRCLFARDFSAVCLPRFFQSLQSVKKGDGAGFFLT